MRAALCSEQDQLQVLGAFNPFPTSEWRSPWYDAVISNTSGVPFYDKYADQDGEAGWLVFHITGSPGNMDGTPRDGSFTSPGGQSTLWTNSGFPPGEYWWVRWARDISGASTSTTGDAWRLWVNAVPGAPPLSAPQAGGTVPTSQPVLSLTGANPDPEGDYVAYQYHVASDAGCSNVVASSGWLPMSATTWTPPSGVLQDGQDYYWCAQAADFVARYCCANEGPKSTSRLIRVRLPKLGVQSYWPMFSRVPVAVNEATGNLVLSVPGPSFTSAAGTIGAGFTYNLLDTRTSAFTSPVGAWTVGLADGPSKLIDHNVLTGDLRFDAVERVAADGGSDYYAHVAGGNTYQAAAGDPSILAKNSSGYTLTDPDGSIYTFGPADGTTGVATLTGAQVSAAQNGQAEIAYTFAAGKPTSIVARAKDSGGVMQTLQTLTLNWSCAGAIVCISGPDGQTWKYVGDATGGTSGKLVTVFNGTRNVLQLGYDANGRPSSIRNANDLDPDAASPGYTGSTGNPGTHELQISYDTSPRVTSVKETQVRDRYYTPTRRDLEWTFAYSGTSTCALSGRTPHAPDAAAGHTGATRTIAGCTDITVPEQQGVPIPKRASVFYDNVAHPVETVDLLGNYSLAQYNGRHQLEWTEDALEQPTDYAYDSFSFLPTTVTGPDPDTAGSGLPRPVTTTFFDEQAPGTGAAPGTALQGLQAFYYANPDLIGRPATTQTDPNVDFDWSVTGPGALGGQRTNIGVRWTGVVSVPAQADYVFATVAEAGTRLVVDGLPLIDQWTGQAVATPVCSPLVNLKAGKHRLTLEYHQLGTTNTQVRLRWTNGGTATCANATTAIGSAALTPDWQNQTSVVTPASTTGAGTRLAFAHFAAPDTHQPDYTAADATGARLITSFVYDAFGRPTQKVTPKGNVNRTIAANGDLTGTVVTGYDVLYGYYAIGELAAPPAACGTLPSVNQVSLPKSITPKGVAATTTVYDAAGRSIATSNAAGSTCRTYDAESRLATEKAAGETTPRTYTYDPAGATRTVADASGTVTSIYDESGLLVDTVDSYGAELEEKHDKNGSTTTRRVATGALGTSTVYDTDYEYDANGRLVKQIFLPAQTTPTLRTYEFSWDARGALVATRYPNATFSWNTYLATGWLSSTLSRHGTLASPPPATGSAPADAGNELSDFANSYFADGRISQTTRTGAGLGAGETTQYGYDGVGRLSTVSFPDATSRKYCYDANSNRVSSYASSAATCGVGSPAATYAYSTTVLDRLTSATVSGQTRSFAYDADGNTTGSGSDTLAWDTRGRHSGGSLPSLQGVQFTVDGNPSAGEDTSSPYSTTLNTGTLTDGWHTIGAVARNREGKTAPAPTRVIRTGNGQPATSISLVANLGSGVTISSVQARISVSTTIPIGSTVVIAATAGGQDLFGGAGSLSSVTDSRGNTYVIDQPTIRNGNANVAIASGRVTTALGFADTITATFTNTQCGGPRIAGAAFSGVTSAIPRIDQTATGTGTSATPTTAASAPTTTQPELVIGAFGSSSTASFTAGGGSTFLAGGNVCQNSLHMQYRLVTSAGPQTSSGTYDVSRKWRAALITYKPETPSPPDTTPPTTPAGLGVSAVPGKITLSWTASTDASGIARYHVHRSTTSGFTPSGATEIAETTLLAYTDAGDGTTSGLSAGTYYYKLIAEDTVGNQSGVSAESSVTISADPTLPRAALTAPAAGAQVSGIIALSATASDPIGTHSLSYGFDAAGFRRSRTLNGTTTRYLLGGLMETDAAGTISGFDVDGPAGDLAHYATAPSSAVNPTYSYYTAHGDLAAEATQAGVRTALHRYDPFGAPLVAPTGSGTAELFTGRWDKKQDVVTGLIEMGARPYDSGLGRFLAVDPVEGGSSNSYDYARQDPLGTYDLDGRCPVRWILDGRLCPSPARRRAEALLKETAGETAKGTARAIASGGPGVLDTAERGLGAYGRGKVESARIQRDFGRRYGGRAFETGGACLLWGLRAAQSTVPPATVWAGIGGCAVGGALAWNGVQVDPP